MPGKINKTTKETLKELLRKGVTVEDAAAFFGIDQRSILALIKGAAAEKKQQIKQENENHVILSFEE